MGGFYREWSGSFASKTAPPLPYMNSNVPLKMYILAFFWADKRCSGTEEGSFWTVWGSKNVVFGSQKAHFGPFWVRKNIFGLEKTHCGPFLALFIFRGWK